MKRATPKLRADKKKCPTPPNLAEHILALAQIFAANSFLPNEQTARELNYPIFQTLRNPKRRYQLHYEKNAPVAMYDDNTTPRWALLWAHGIEAVAHQKGWQFSHVWPASEDRHAYTRVANLALVPECFGGLTDKQGPLVPFLRWHAWCKYLWKPANKMIPQCPAGFETITWQYLPYKENPARFISDRMGTLNNRVTRTLASLTQAIRP